MIALRIAVGGLLLLSILPAGFVGWAAWTDTARDISGDAAQAALFAAAYVTLALVAGLLIMPPWQCVVEADNA